MFKLQWIALEVRSDWLFKFGPLLFTSEHFTARFAVLLQAWFHQHIILNYVIVSSGMLTHCGEETVQH